jgi:rare lipoprotein A
MFELVALMMMLQQPALPVAEGVASYYTVASNGPQTASGERLRDEEFTLAMRNGRFGSRYLVVAENGRSVICRLNDRGPFIKNRVADLSRAAMRQLHPDAGILKVRVYPLPPDSSPRRTGKLRPEPKIEG